MSNISSINRTPTSSKKVSIDEVLEKLSVWRSNKSTQSEKIPDEIWSMVFVLTEKYSEKSLRELLGISHAQFKAKREQIKKASEQGMRGKDPNAVELTELKFSSEEDDEFLNEQYLPNDIIATNTVVVEIYNKHGECMKIHTVTQRFKELLRAFGEGLTDAE